MERRDMKRGNETDKENCWKQRAEAEIFFSAMSNEIRCDAKMNDEDARQTP
jgi:hypothetical protein